MGNCHKPGPRGERNRDDAIGKGLAKQHRDEIHVIRVLLLGTGDSGKSTIFKQAKKYGGKEIPQSEKLGFSKPIYNNIIGQAKALVKVVELLGLKYSSEEAEKAALDLKELDMRVLGPSGISIEMAGLITYFWKDSAVQDAWKRRSEYNLFDCAEYFFQDNVLNRIAEGGKDYVPSFEDILNVRYPTTGIVRQRMRIKQGLFEFIDVGGQRSERRKWISCFNNVTTVLFVTALSEYDQLLFEDTKVSRIDEALKVWQDIVNREDFRNVAFLLFFNKWDIFQKKITQTPFKITEGENSRNANYEGPDPMKFKNGSPEQTAAISACASHIETQFTEKVNLNRQGGITTHRSIATDINNFNVLFANCLQQILKDALLFSGF